MKTTEKNGNSETESLSELVAKAKAGDQEAFSELYNRTSTDLYRSIRAMTRDEDLTWDIQQDAYLHAYQKLDTLDNNEAFFPWLRRIAVNATVSRMRQRLPLTFTELSGDDEDDSFPELPDLNAANQPELSLDRKETSRLVKEILAKLPEEQQLIVGMRYYDELSVKEIANTLSISEGTVKAQLFQGRKKVESAVRALEKQGVKLYGLSPLPFLLALMKQQALPVRESEAVLAKTLTKAGIAAGAKASTPVILQATKPFFTTLAGKIVLGVMAAGVVAGAAAGYRWAKDNLFENSNPILTPDSSEDLRKNPTTPTVPVQVEDTEPAIPVSFDPEVTEPAQPARADNECGEHLTWSFDADRGALTIEGSGPMDDYADVRDVPWYKHRQKIWSVRFPGELTHIGSNAFAGCEQLNNAYGLETSAVTSIGEKAFLGCSFTELKLPAALEAGEFGESALKNCTQLCRIVCPEELAALPDGAFSHCDALTELWIMNTDCVIGAGLANPAQVKICGLPDSTAQQYAQENGYSFSPIVDDPEVLRERLRLDQTESGELTRISVIVQFGSRYLAEVTHSGAVTATAEELRQAREAGVITLNGKDYPVTESMEKAMEWGYVSEETDADCWIGWPEAGTVYEVREQGDHYIFMAYQYAGTRDPYLRSDYSDFCWVWLDEDTPIVDPGYGEEEALTLSNYPGDTWAITANYWPELDEDGRICLVKKFSGRK